MTHEQHSRRFQGFNRCETFKRLEVFTEL